MDAIPGLRYRPDFLDAKAQNRLLATIDRQPWMADLKRRVQHYGYHYDYRRRNVDLSLYLGALPDWLTPLAERVQREKLMADVPDQVIVNEYLPGQGIASHVDCEPCFGDTILSLSLGSPCVMVFTSLDSGERVEVLLEPGSLVVMQGEARRRWQHGIPARKTDVFDGQTYGRRRRVSVTLRQVILDMQPSL